MVQNEIDVVWPDNRENVQNGERTRKLGQSIMGVYAIYQIQGDEIFVRAKVTSTKRKKNASYSGELETCWTQPFVIN